MATDMELLKGSWTGDNTQCTQALETVVAAVTDYFHRTLTDGGTAATAVAEQAVFVVIHRCRLPTGSVPGASTANLFPKFVSGVAITASDTDNVVVTLGRRRPAAGVGGSLVPVARYTSNVAGTGTALWVGEDLTIIGDPQFEVGDVLTVSVTKGGAGAAIASATVPASIFVPLEKN